MLNKVIEKNMKKTYMMPTLDVVKVELHQMLAASTPELSNKDAISAGMSRDYDFDDED